MRPMFAFCNWQFIVAGYNPDSSASESKLTSHQVELTVSSDSMTAFGLVSAENKEFDFGGSGEDSG